MKSEKKATHEILTPEQLRETNTIEAIVNAHRLVNDRIQELEKLGYTVYQIFLGWTNEGTACKSVGQKRKEVFITISAVNGTYNRANVVYLKHQNHEIQ